MFLTGTGPESEDDSDETADLIVASCTLADNKPVLIESNKMASEINKMAATEPTENNRLVIAVEQENNITNIK